MPGDIMSSRKGLHFFIFVDALYPITERHRKTTFSRSSLAKATTEIPVNSAYTHFGFRRCKEVKTTLRSKRGERIWEAWFWRNRRWLIFSCCSSCAVLSSQCVALVRVCRVIRKMSTVTLLSVSILHFLIQHSNLVVQLCLIEEPISNWHRVFTEARYSIAVL